MEDRNKVLFGERNPSRNTTPRDPSTIMAATEGSLKSLKGISGGNVTSSTPHALSVNIGALDSSNRGVFRANRRTIVVEYATTLGFDGAKKPPKELLGEAKVALDIEHRFEAALDLFTLAIDAAPGCAEAWCGRGTALVKAESPLVGDNHAEAKACLERALTLDAKLADAHAQLGVLLLSEGLVDDAEAAIRRALAIDPNNSTALLNLGHVLYAKGDTENAERNVRRSVEMGPTSDGLYSLGNLTAQRGDTAEAQRLYKQAIEMAPEHSGSAYFELGGILEQESDLDGAEGAYRKAVARLGGDAGALAAALVALGNLMNYARGDWKSGEDFYRKALEVDPRNADARYNLGSLLRTQGDTGAAEEFLRSRLDSALESEYSDNSALS